MIYDVTMPIHPDMQVYKNKQDKKPIFTYQIQHSPHDISETNVFLPMHTGTHMDFPKHMDSSGKTSTGFDSTTFFNQSVVVIDCLHVEDRLTLKDIEGISFQKGDTVFFKTKNSLHDMFLNDFVYVSLELAEKLSTLDLLAVGIDGLGIERNDPMHQTHVTLMRQDVYIIEGLRLKEVPPGRYRFTALPIHVLESDALPLRVLIHN
jgi:arylformamidase